MRFFHSFRVNLMWTQSKKSFFASVGGQLLLRHERTLFSQTTSHAGMEKYSWHTNRWFSLGTWRTSIPISFVCTVAVPRQLRLLCAAVHWRSCKQNNWHFFVQTVFRLFLLLLQHHPAKFQSLQTFILGFIGIIIMPRLVRHCLKSNLSVWKAALA